jgi:hypothetical protein
MERLMKNLFILILCLQITAYLTSGQDFKKTAPAINLENGDTFVFIGNSITHQCLYTQYVEDYYYTRYPNKRITFHNAGVSGDVAADVLNRFDNSFLPGNITVMDTGIQ